MRAKNHIMRAKTTLNEGEKNPIMRAKISISVFKQKNDSVKYSDP
jgi:hypothetical protein